RGGGVEHRGNVALVEQDAVVRAALDDAGDAQARVGRGDVDRLQQLKAQAPDLDQRGAIERRVAVLDLELAGDVARQAVGAGAPEVGLVHARPAHRQREGDERVAQRGRNVQGRR